MAEHLAILRQYAPAALLEQIDANHERARDALAGAVRRAVAAYGALGVAEDDFVAHAASRLSPERDPLAALEQLRADELYLAQACAQGSSKAIAILEERYLGRLDRRLARLSHAPGQEADLKQEVRERLLCAHAGRPGLLLSYGGRGDLNRWLEITAARVALRSRGRPSPLAAISEEILPDSGADPAADVAEQHDATQLAAALAAGMAKVSPEDKLLLKHHFLDGLDAKQIAQLYGIHRATVFRRISEACRAIARRVQPHLRRHLRAGTTTLRGLLAETGTRAAATLARLFQSGGTKRSGD